MLDLSKHKGAYTAYSIFYFGQKVSFELINCTFAYKYWIVSCTLRQAFSNNELKFSEQKHKIAFAVVMTICVILSAIDSILYWYSEMIGDDFISNISDWTYVIYTSSLFVSLSFLTFSIYRIHSLLKNHPGVKLNNKHMILHAAFLFLNISLCLFMTFSFLFGLERKTATKYASLAQFCI